MVWHLNELETATLLFNCQFHNRNEFVRRPFWIIVCVVCVEYICFFLCGVHSDPSLHPSSSVGSLVVSVPLSSGVNLPSHTTTASIAGHHQITNIKSFTSAEQQQTVSTYEFNCLALFVCT